ncbi:MAG: hypothetical protein ABIH92_00050 [Nanoarchaeota archaeon]
MNNEYRDEATDQGPDLFQIHTCLGNLDFKGQPKYSSPLPIGHPVSLLDNRDSDSQLETI